MGGGGGQRERDIMITPRASCAESVRREFVPRVCAESSRRECAPRVHAPRGRKGRERVCVQRLKTVKYTTNQYL